MKRQVNARNTSQTTIINVSELQTVYREQQNTKIKEIGGTR